MALGKIIAHSWDASFYKMRLREESRFAVLKGSVSQTLIHTHHTRILLNRRFQFNRSGGGPQICISDRLLGGAMLMVPGPHLH